MLAIRHTVCVLLVLPLLLGGCGGDGADDGDKPRPPAGGGVILRLKVAAGESGMRWDWSGEPRALVNGVARTVGFDADGVPVVGADVSADGLYTVHFPADAYSRAKRAFVLPPAQFPVSGGSPQAAPGPPHGGPRLLRAPAAPPTSLSGWPSASMAALLPTTSMPSSMPT